MIDVCAYMKSLKLSWLRRIVSSECDKCYTILDNFLDIKKLFNRGKLYTAYIYIIF
jgi:hypothetical protein